MSRIITAAVSRILDFTLDIEAENPDAGEAPVDDVPVAAEKVDRLLTNHFYGFVGNIAQNSSAFNQTASINLSDVRELVGAIEQHLDDLNSDRAARASVEAQIETIKTELAADKPMSRLFEKRVTPFGQSLRTLRPM
jgi:hypothetical protein